MGQQPADPVQFDCAEPDCTEKVTYQRQELPGLAYDRPQGPKTIYLECPVGHVHAYRLGG